MTTALLPSSSFRKALLERGGATAGKCYQCATCSSVCDLAPAAAPFPRRQMLWAQWGLADRLAGDPSVWLCHQCNDCTARCPRDARPGDVLQAVRGLLVEDLAFPRFLGRLVGNAGTTWPLLLGLPILFWIALLAAAGLLSVPQSFHAYEQLVPHWLIYAVYLPVAGYVAAVSWVSGRRLWRALGAGGPRSGSFFGQLMPVATEIATHKRFAKCGTAASRRSGHLALFWGFVGAAVTSGLLIIAIYIQGLPMPLPLAHPYKILGNLSALLLLVGAGILVANRLRDGKRTGVSTAFDSYFAWLVGLVIVSGIVVELARLLAGDGMVSPAVALGLYVAHLGVVLALFLSFPYSKFAHLLYRTLAIVHQRMADRKEPTAA
ncbi:MAG TPA: quinone-interacting membrane-bound oxidoreductase complex subunit QmoC [Vicinamibacteria bacterium]|nr:quinone-interacting membrane-bound oxidoreductase complex subunit QmoC [Vicinamibacteria bacterium]